MSGVVIGDIIGPQFGSGSYRHTDSDTFSPNGGFTNNTICTVTIAGWVSQGCNGNLASILQDWRRAYPCLKGAYGSRFSQWIEWKSPVPYSNWGNGSAMRISAVGWASATLEETLRSVE